MRRLGIAITLVVALAAGAAFGIFHYAKQKFDAPGPLAETRTVIIPRGLGLASVARLLGKEGVVSEPWVFRAAVRYLNQGRKLRAGEFEFPSQVSMRDALNIITSGQTVAHKVTLPEGHTSREIIELVNAVEVLEGDVELVPPEGSLLPETYHFTRGDSREEVVQRMSEAMTELVAALWPKRKEGLPLNSPREAIVLASIVEKETGLSGERRLVAGVFVNRLAKGMKLQSDPTVIYGLTQGQQELGRSLTKKDLKTATPYNTYTIPGLPPGSIVNPGRASLEAVLQPADTEFLYFVADGTGGHAFAKTLKEHNRNVAHWRKVEKARKANASN